MNGHDGLAPNMICWEVINGRLSMQVEEKVEFEVGTWCVCQYLSWW